MVVESILLYACQIWGGALKIESYLKKVDSMQRLVTLSITRGYKTASTGLKVLTRTVPLDLLVAERNQAIGKTAADKWILRSSTLEEWQTRWKENSRGVWLHRLIPDFVP